MIYPIICFILQFRAKYNPTKWPIAIDEPDPVSHSPTPTSSIANSDHSGRDASNNDTCLIEREMYNNGELTLTTSIDKYVNDIADINQPGANYSDSAECFILPNTAESEEAYISLSPYTSQVDCNTFSKLDLGNIAGTGIVQNSVESYNSCVQTTESVIYPAPPAGNLNPNVPEFVPTLAHGSCAESLNYENSLDKNSDIEGNYII